MTPCTHFGDGLWLLASRAMAYNAGAWISQGEAALIDPGVFPDEVDQLAETVAAQGASVSAIILSHSHWDHILGPERLPPVRTLAAHRRYVDQVGQYGAVTRRQIAAWERARGISRQRAFAFPRPEMLVDEAGTLRVGRLTLQLWHVPGHAADQLAVYAPETGALWASDILSDAEIPFVSDSLQAYEQTLAWLAGQTIRALVPGHGSPTRDPREIQARLEADRSYLAELRRRVAGAVQSGKSVAETVAACQDMSYRRREEMTGYHRLNVESAYIELGGPADRRQVGWDREDEAADA